MTRSHRRRLRFQDISFELHPDGRCTVDVGLEWAGVTHRGLAHGVGPLQGELRTAALATLEAASIASERRITFTLTGVKTVRAFDALIIIAAVHAQAGEEHYRLLGVKSPGADEKPVETAARAVLDAINRVLEIHMVVPEPSDPGVGVEI